MFCRFEKKKKTHIHRNPSRVGAYTPILNREGVDNRILDKEVGEEFGEEGERETARCTTLARAPKRLSCGAHFLGVPSLGTTFWSVFGF